MIVGLDVGFGYTKRVTAAGTDVFPSVVGEWRADGFALGARLNGADQLGRIEGVTVEGRSYAVGERALRLAHRRFVGLHRRWTDSAAFRVLALAALARGLERRGARHPRHRPSGGGHRAARRDPAPAARGRARGDSSRVAAPGG